MSIPEQAPPQPSIGTASPVRRWGLRRKLAVAVVPTLAFVAAGVAFLGTGGAPTGRAMACRSAALLACGSLPAHFAGETLGVYNDLDCYQNPEGQPNLTRLHHTNIKVVKVENPIGSGEYASYFESDAAHEKWNNDHNQYEGDANYVGTEPINANLSENGVELNSSGFPIFKDYSEMCKTLKADYPIGHGVWNGQVS